MEQQTASTIDCLCSISTMFNKVAQMGTVLWGKQKGLLALRMQRLIDNEKPVVQSLLILSITKLKNSVH